MHLALPVDLLECDVDSSGHETNAGYRQLDFGRTLEPLDQSNLDRLVELIAPARQPLIVCGPAMSATRVGLTLTQLSVAMDAPVIAMESPRGLKDPSLGDFASVLARADLVISLGKTIDFMLGFGAGSVDTAARKWIMIDADAREHERAQLNLAEPLILGLTANPVDVAEQLIALSALSDLRLNTAVSTAQTPRLSWREEVTRLIAKRTSNIHSRITVQTTLASE